MKTRTKTSTKTKTSEAYDRASEPKSSQGLFVLCTRNEGDMAEFRIGVLIDVTAETAADAYAKLTEIMTSARPAIGWESTDEWYTWNKAELGSRELGSRELDRNEVRDAREEYFEKKGVVV